jgi:hypothetical protein
MDHSCQYLCSELVRVTYEDGPGQFCQTAANLEEVSPTGVTILLEDKPRLGSAIFLMVKERDVTGVVTSTVHDTTLGWFVNITLDVDPIWRQEWFSTQRLLAVCPCFSEDVTPAEARALEETKITEENALVSFLASHA